MIFYEPGGRDPEILPHDPFKALVAPRPIGWISTLSEDGQVNLAPYSFFNAVAEGPLMLAFSSRGAKDSSTFATEIREFVWNLVTFELREAMNETSAPLPRGAVSSNGRGSRWPLPAGRAARGSLRPGAQWSAEWSTISSCATSGNTFDQHLVIGQVVGIHLDEAAIVGLGRRHREAAAGRPVRRPGRLRGRRACVPDVPPAGLSRGPADRTDVDDPAFVRADADRVPFSETTSTANRSFRFSWISSRRARGGAAARPFAPRRHA